MFNKNGAKILAARICDLNASIKTTNGENYSRNMQNNDYFNATTDINTSGITMRICSDNITIDDDDYKIPQSAISFTFTSATRSVSENGTVTYTFVGTNNGNPFTIKSLVLTMYLQDWRETYLIYENNVTDRTVGTNETFTFTVRFVAR